MARTSPSFEPDRADSIPWAFYNGSVRSQTIMRHVLIVLFVPALCVLLGAPLARLTAGRPQPPPGRGPALMMVEANRAYERALKTGRRLWRSASPPTSANGASCSTCHGPDATRLAPAARHYPRLDPATARVIPLEQRIALCIQQRMRGKAPAPGSSDSVALLVYLKEGR